MLRRLVSLLASLVLLGALSSPSRAQDPPKVTIEGLVDFVTTAYKNMSHGLSPAGATPGHPDVTNPVEKGWYSRERGLFTITGEIGKVKGVWAS